MKKYLLLIVFFVLTLKGNSQAITDVDGNTYNTVTIGTQVWMKENLKSTKFNDGTKIPGATTLEWGNLTTPAYCWYNNAISFKSTYGALYNWYTVNTSILCPAGWHVPSFDEMTTLISFLGEGETALKKMREGGNVFWANSSVGTNSSGFTALPGGELVNNLPASFFSYLGVNAKWWTSTGRDEFTAWPTDTDGTSLYRYYVDKKMGCSIRCLINTAVSVNSTGIIYDRNLYPNPAKDKLYIHFNSPDFSGAIFDLKGKKIMEIRTDASQMDISNLPKGVYLVKIIESGIVKTDKLIKE